jgi:hypothetical protein
MLAPDAAGEGQVICPCGGFILELRGAFQPQRVRCPVCNKYTLECWPEVGK